jgi:hypothetical protein
MHPHKTTTNRTEIATSDARRMVTDCPIRLDVDGTDRQLWR